MAALSPVSNFLFKKSDNDAGSPLLQVVINIGHNFLWEKEAEGNRRCIHIIFDEKIATKITIIFCIF